MNQTAPEHCYLCGNKTVSIRAVVNQIPLFFCNGCNLTWADIADDSKILEETYGAAYYSEDKLDEGLGQIGYTDYLSNEQNHRANARAIFKDLESEIKLAGLKILDIGCGFGFLLDELQHTNDVCGVELSAYAQNFAKTKLGLAVVNKNVLAIEDFDGKFDVVFLIGSIEHMTDPRAVLKKTQSFLKRGGYIVVTTVNTNVRLYSLKPPEHLFYFNPDNLALLMQQAGFSAVKVKAYKSYYNIFDVVHRLAVFLKLPIVPGLTLKLLKRAPQISLQIPTNEFILIGKKA